MPPTDAIKTTSEAVSQTVAVPEFGSRRRLAAREFLQLSKPGITRLVTVASGVGFAMSAAWSGVDLASSIVPIIGCLIGTAVASSGANGLNQVLEVDRDSLMERTADRPLPGGRLDRGSAWLFALACAVLGPLLIAATCNWVAGVVAGLTVLLYVCVYTPLKPITPASTYIGAIPGAMPCLIGWTAASPTPLADLQHAPAWSVFAILAVWQIPHFFAIAFMYREQYRRAGFKPLPEGAGPQTVARWILAWTGLAVAASALPLASMPTLVGGLYAAVASVLAAVFVYSAVVLTQRPTVDRARRVFLTSIAYLPVVYLALVGDALVWNPA